MHDVLELSYTGDLLAHRRCSRAWAYEKHAGFHPYEQIQAMEGRLVHHAMEWLTRRYQTTGLHAAMPELRAQLEHYFRVLWARGIRTAFRSKKETLDGVMGHLFPGDALDPIAQAAIEGAEHTEYELRSVRKFMGPLNGGKQKLLLTGILDLVVQQKNPLSYQRVYEWKSSQTWDGGVVSKTLTAQPGDVEIWDYKATQSSTSLLPDYIRQMLTYAYLYEERSGQLPVRCVLYFVNEKNRDKKLLAIEIDQDLIRRAVDWTMNEAIEIQQTLAQFQMDPGVVPGGERSRLTEQVGQRITTDLQAQCTACSLRFDCSEYLTHLGGCNHPDVDIWNVFKN